MSAAHVVLVAILLCSALIQWTNIRETHVVAPGRPDAASYVSYAYNLREYGVYSRDRTWNAPTPSRPVADSVSPPGYPLFLVPFMRGAPDMDFMARVVLAQAGLGVISTLLVFLLAARILHPMLACTVALLAAITPQLSVISVYVLTESLFTCLLLASTWAFVRATQSTRTNAWLLAGFLFGLCCLVRPTLQALPPLALAVIALVPRWRHWLRGALLATACWAALLAPWVVYQRSLPRDSDQPSLFRATIYHGSFPDFVYDGHVENFGYPARDDPHAAQIMASNAGLAEWVGGRMRAAPLRYLRWYVLGKPRYFLAWDDNVAAMGDVFIYPVDASPYFNRPMFRLTHALMVGLHWPLMLLGIAGGVLALGHQRWLALVPGARRGACVVGIVFLSAIVFHVIGAPYPRYGIPFWPLAYLLAIAAAATTIDRMRALRRPNRLSNGMT